MKVAMKLIMVAAAIIAVGLVSGCGGGGGGVTAPSGAGAAPSSAPSAGAASDGATLYAAYCAGCHGPLASSQKLGATAGRIQSGIANVSDMSSLSSLTTAQIQAIATVLAPASTPVTSAFDGAAYYTANCAGCHGALASSQKLGASVGQIQAGIASVSGMSSFSSLTTAQLQAIATALTPAATPPPPVTDGVVLYSTNCASCHGALAVSTKGGSSAATIQTAINNNAGGVMGSLSTLTTTQVGAIATVLAGVTAQPAACGSCHAIPPSTGHHSTHKSAGIQCATCHGSGYSPTTVNAATHNNGVKNLTTTIGWNATSRSCSNSCHGSRSW